MINFLKTKKMVLLFFIVLSILFLVLIFTISNQKNRTDSGRNPGTNPTEESKLKVVNFNPDPSMPLSLNNNQAIQLEFNKPIERDLVEITLTRKDILKDEKAEKVKFEKDFINDKTLEVIFFEPILPLNEYILEVFDEKNNLVSRVIYTSEDIKPTPVVKNNIELSSFLPYETESFRLSYNEEKNIYIFNFKYNEESNDSLLDQYEKAKKQATEYIKSNNIDPDSIVIEWRYS